MFFKKVTYAMINSPFVTVTANGPSELPTRFDKCDSLLRSLQRCSASLTSLARSPFYVQNSRGRDHKS